MKKHPKLKVVIMSATMQADVFRRYFQGSAAATGGKIPEVAIPGRTFPVQVGSGTGVVERK